METITFRCTTCQHVLKIGADKAGRKATCNKCGTPLTIPLASDEEKEPALSTAKPAAAQKDDDDEGGPLTYAFKEEQETERKQRHDERRIPVPQGPGRRKGKRLAKITNAREWVRVGFGLQLVAVGLCVWLGAYLLFRMPLVLGLATGEEYAAQADVDRLVSSPPTSGKAPDLDYCSYAITLLSGNFWGTFMVWMCRLAQVVFLLMYFLLVAGYVICLAVPPHRGARLQLTVLLCLAAANALFGIIFRLLPLLGVYEYTILPAVVPEIAMIEMNAERVESIYRFWLRWPILELFWAMLLNLMTYLEPAMIAVFLRTVARGLKSEELEAKAMTLMKLAFSQLYIQLAWMMGALCGTSEVLLTVLRFVYIIGMGFFIGQMVYCIILLFSVPSVVAEQLGDEAEELLAKAEDEDEMAVTAADAEEDDDEE